MQTHNNKHINTKSKSEEKGGIEAKKSHFSVTLMFMDFILPNILVSLVKPRLTSLLSKNNLFTIILDDH